MLISVLTVLFLNFIEKVFNGFSFIIRKMKRFIYLIVEK